MNFDLVFEGGGAKGMVFVGAMQEFERRGHTYGRLLGTSAGAITATLLAAGYTSDEMLAALNEKLPNGLSVFTSFMGIPGPFTMEEVKNSSIRAFLRSVDIPLLPEFLEAKVDDSINEMLAKGKKLRHIFSLVERGGWYSADYFLNWLKNKLDSGSFKNKARNFGNMTLQQYFEATNTALSLVASDTVGRQMLVLNHITAPNCPVIWATRMSMSVPLLWQEVVWQPEWGLYNGYNIDRHSIVDGGLLSNFPIELFLSDLKDVTSVMGEKINAAVLGMLIDEDMPVPGAQSAAAAARPLSLADLVTIQRILRLVDTSLSARDKMVIDSYPNLVVRMPAKGFGTTEFDMSEERRETLVSAGRQALKHYFEMLEKTTAAPAAFNLSPQEQIRTHNRIDQVANNILR